jgi:DNA primase
MAHDSLIVNVIRRYHPDWEPPQARGRWNTTLCPFHGDTNKSASISFELNAFNCFVCDAGGDAIKIIREQEGVSFAEALRITEGLSVEGHAAVPRKSARKSGRRVFGESWTSETGGKPVRSGIRSRPTPWT